MEKAELRSKIIDVVEKANEAHLRELFALMVLSSSSSALSAEQIKELDARRARHINDESKSFTWQEIRQNLRDNGLPA